MFSLGWTGWSSSATFWVFCSVLNPNRGRERWNVWTGLFWISSCDRLWPVFLQVGFKPAGGIRTAQESLVWLTLIKEELGSEWLHPHLFRFGASSLLADIERQVRKQSRPAAHRLVASPNRLPRSQIYHEVTGQYAAHHELPMAWSHAPSRLLCKERKKMKMLLSLLWLFCLPRHRLKY